MKVVSEDLIHPIHPMWMILLPCSCFFFVVMFSINYLTDEATECLMVAMNVVLVACNSQFRFPARAKTLMKAAGVNDDCCDGVKTYVVCKNCHGLNGNGTGIDSNHYADVPDYCPACENVCLFTRNKVTQEINRNVPTKLFYYNSIASTLRKFFARPDFVQLINQWKTMSQNDDDLSQIHNGNVFKTFARYNEGPFVEQSDYYLLIRIYNTP